ncbi:MAG: AAA family ATPase [Cyanobacteriota bacterium]
MTINNEDKTCWFVGASYGGTDDQTPRFVNEGIWENGYKDKYINEVKAIKEGDRIAIKSSYIRKNNLPFDNKGYNVSVMAIKAIGIVEENFRDGRRLRVKWKLFDKPREWYFYTYQRMIWKVSPGEWKKDALINFTFNDAPQDFDLFRNDPFWFERYGDSKTEKKLFLWSHFYMELADKLVKYQFNRPELISAIQNIAKDIDCLTILQDQFSDGTIGPIKDICPFTTFSILNRGIKEENRKNIARRLAEFLGVETSVPESFEGIPIVNNQRTWFYSYEKDRNADDINILWNIFIEAINFADSDEPDLENFLEAYNKATEVKGVGWNLTMGFYWIRPWFFLPLDSQSQKYITKKLLIPIEKNGPKNRCNATDYLSLRTKLETRFQEETYPVHSFPELSLKAWYFNDTDNTVSTQKISSFHNEDQEIIQESEDIRPQLEAYSIENIMEDGCFLEKVELKRILERLRGKKNLILQGPPGTGKTWLAKRLALALIGEHDENKINVVQFHPNLSYEDFVRGWRPSGDGKLILDNGPFLKTIEKAILNPNNKYVFVIEEINRGTPAQIFGEMLTLLEADKRTPNEALELCYRKYDHERVYIPDNLYIIGTMNLADRSLAIVDFAFRRRFAFVDLKPCLGDSWKNWLVNQHSFDITIINEIQKRIIALNEVIESDPTLGQQYCIGHSYVTPSLKMNVISSDEWFKQVVTTEIGPLLEEYWFDSREKAINEIKKLIEGFNGK